MSSWSRAGGQSRHRRGIATVSISGTLEDKLAAISAAGFDGAEIFENDLIACPLAPEEIRRRAAALGLETYLYQPFRDFEGVTTDRLDANIRRLEAKFNVMARLGADRLLVCSNVQPDAIDDDDTSVSQLAVLAERAHEHGVTVAYEALAWGSRVNTFEHAWKLVKAADRPNLGVCLDSFHILSRTDDLDGLADIPSDKIAFVQLADAPRLQMDVVQWSRHFRCFPGQGRLDLVGFMRALRRTGYAGPVSLEVFNDVFRQSDPVTTAVDGLRSLIALEERLELTAGDLSGDAARTHRLPAAPPLKGYAFAELAVDAAGDRPVARQLSAMGFRRSGVHRSKAVALWTHGGASILLNQEPVPARRGAWPLISALGVESSAPAASADRAAALLATPVPRHREPAEAPLTAIQAPGGTALFFCGIDQSDRTSNWRGDFDPLADVPGSEPTFDVHAIDHIALAHPLETFDEAVLFYESIAGLRPEGAEDVATVSGLLRSRALVNSESTFRLALNAPALGRRMEPGLLPQHVAFSVSDAVAAARWMTARGLAVLSVPRNYYDDLLARHRLDPSRVDQLADLDVMYDRDSDGGELLHFYTVSAGPALCFEFLQRKSGYAGYGANNTPVRAASQARIQSQVGSLVGSFGRAQTALAGIR